MLSTAPFECPTDLLDRARGAGRSRVAVAGAANAVTLESARLAAEAEILEPVLVGPSGAIAAAAEKIDWNLTGLEIVDAVDEKAAAEQAVDLAREGAVTAIMKGSVHTDVLLRAILRKEIGLRTGRRLSHVFHMTVPGRPGSLLITDAAINVAPNLDTRLDILRNVLGFAQALGKNRPRVAALSATETPMEAMPSSLEAAEFVERARALELPLDIEGPMALDLAVSPSAAEIKGMPGGGVFGAAEVVLVPNIETGNALFKSMVYFAGATAGGLVLGARVPVMLTSRADPPEARLASAALAAVVAGASTTGSLSS